MDFVFPLSVLLFPYALFLLFFVLWGAFTLYHLLRFSVYGKVLYAVVGVFLVGAVLLVGGSMWAVSRYDWTRTVSLSETFTAPSLLVPTRTIPSSR